MKPATKYTNTTWFLNLFLVCLAIVAIIYLAISVIFAVHTTKVTGILDISSSDSQANLTVTQNNSYAVSVGRGTAAVRLKPGSYEINASDSGYQTDSVVNITKKHTSSVNLNLVSAGIPSSSYNLFNQLPITGAASLYTISEGHEAVNNGSPNVIVIDATTPQNRQYALQWIRNQGYDPSDFKIQFVDQAIEMITHPYAD
jgi:hypothetical protein